MSQGFKVALIAIALILEFYLLLGLNPYPHGMIGDVKYRRVERLTAYRDYTLARSPETKVPLDRELALMHKHEDWKNYLGAGLLVLGNILIIYLFLKNERTTEQSGAMTELK